jgi:hypothetical protein
LALALWTIVCLGIFWPSPALRIAAGVLLAGYIATTVRRVHRETLVLAGALAAIGVALSAADGAGGALLDGFLASAVFGAFFLSVGVLRATAVERPEVAAARRTFAALSAGQRSGGFLVGAHLLGAVISVGAMAITAPILGPQAGEDERRRAAEVCLRGMCLAAQWSPFWVAMGVGYQHLPDVKLWQILALGIGCTLVGLAVAHLLYARATGPRLLWRAVVGLAPLFPPVALCAAVLAGLTGFARLSALQALVLAMPLLCIAALAADRRRPLRRVLGGAWRNADNFGDEVLLLTAALVLGRAFEAAIAAHGVAALIGGLALPPVALIAIVVFGMTAASLVGLHQIVTATVFLVAFAGLGLAPVVLMESVLVGWCFSSMVGISAVSVAVTAPMFRVSRHRLTYGANLWFALAWGAAATVLLAAVNAAVA